MSRLRFVYPSFPETTAEEIEACEAAWTFYGGIFRVVIPDNTKAIVQHADPLAPIINPAFLEYSQARGFHIDATRVRRPKDKDHASHCTSVARFGWTLGKRLRPESLRPWLLAGGFSPGCS